eukprot:gene27129-32679_t
MFGESRSGSGQTHADKSTTAVSSAGMTRLLKFQAPVQVVRGARPLGRHHRGTERIPRSAFLPEGTALVWLDQTLQHFSGT